MSNPTNLDTMIAAYQTAEQALNDWYVLYGTPICGKPGYGFKAARKASATRLAASVRFTDAKIALRNYVQDSKASRERRTRRFETIKALIPTFTLD